MEHTNTINNRMKIEFDSRTSNIAFARVAVSAFMTQLDPTIEEVDDVKTAVSEAVTNAVIHGYDRKAGNTVEIRAELSKDSITIWVADQGHGIVDIGKAMEPMYTTKAENEHSGMGFMFMQAFMDEVAVESADQKGTTIMMKKKIGCEVI